MIYGDLLRKCHELEKEVDELSFENQNLKAENQGLIDDLFDISEEVHSFRNLTGMQNIEKLI